MKKERPTGKILPAFAPFGKFCWNSFLRNFNPFVKRTDRCTHVWLILKKKNLHFSSHLNWLNYNNRIRFGGIEAANRVQHLLLLLLLRGSTFRAYIPKFPLSLRDSRPFRLSPPRSLVDRNPVYVVESIWNLIPDESRILDTLPQKLKTDVAINVHIKTLNKVQLFHDCDEALLRDLVLKLRPVLYLPGDFICRKVRSRRPSIF